jgi:hypothetical protein
MNSTFYEFINVIDIRHFWHYSQGVLFSIANGGFTKDA